jgi:hypothetical protein
MTTEIKKFKKYQIHDRMWRLLWRLRKLGTDAATYEVPTETVDHEKIKMLTREYLPRLVEDPDPGLPQLLNSLYYFLHRVKNAMDQELVGIPLDYYSNDLDFSVYGENFLDGEKFTKLFNQAMPLDVDSFHTNLSRDDLFSILSHMLENDSNEAWMLEYIKALQTDIPDLMTRLGFSLADMDQIHAYMFNNGDVGSDQLVITKPLLEIYRRNKILNKIKLEKEIMNFDQGVQ